MLLDRTPADLTEELFIELFEKKEELEEQLNAMLDAKTRKTLTEQLEAINGTLGEASTYQDDQIDEWEAAIARGESPDLTRGMNNA